MGSATGSATNIDATAVNTIRWLSDTVAGLVVPVYQRQYRWDIGGCEQLLADVRAVADSDERHMHFLGSILSTDDSQDGDPAQLVLIDGQQRITTLMLLIAALQHTARLDHPALAVELQKVLVHPGDAARTKLRPHRAWADVFESVVLDRRGDGAGGGDSRFDANYAFFRSQVRPDEVPRIWEGLQKLEHVAITLGVGANAQQIFESLNSTGEPLRDHELIHNYVLMGLSHTEQSEIEDSFWLPIEQNTGEFIAGFWRDYLVMTSGREVAVAGERGVYDAFRQLFPRLDLRMLREHAAQWREYSEVYRVLLDPTHERDPGIALQLGYLNTFGKTMYPLVMGAYRDVMTGAQGRGILIETLELVQSLLLRRTIVGLGGDRLVARLCRAREHGHDELIRAFARIMPSDARVRVGLKYGALPHPGYVLGRLAGIAGASGLEVEHVFPLSPAPTWSGDGVRQWTDYTDDEQNSHRALTRTLGNLALLEAPLAERAVDLSFAGKRDTLYAASAVPMTAELAETPAWGTAAISQRTARSSDDFMRVWSRPAVAGIDDDDLTPVLDARRRRGWPRGWEREFDYIEYRGEHWEVHDVRGLFNRVFRRLWADARTHVITFSDRRGGPIYDAQSWNGQWDALDEQTNLYMGWDSRYMLNAVQGVLDEAGWAHEVFVKYSYIGAVM